MKEFKWYSASEQNCLRLGFSTGKHTLRCDGGVGFVEGTLEIVLLIDGFVGPCDRE